MELSNLIGLAGTVIAAISAIVAIVQTRQARAARVEAEAANESAAAHGLAARRASERAADALEKQVHLVSLDQARTARGDRARVAAAMKSFIGEWAEGVGKPDTLELDAAIAEAGGGMNDIRTWVMYSGEGAYWAYRFMRHAAQLDAGGRVESVPGDVFRQYFDYREQVRARLDNWTASGQFDLVPLPVPRPSGHSEIGGASDE